MINHRPNKIGDPELFALCRAIEVARHRVPQVEMPSQLLSVFLYIASTDDICTLIHIQEALGIRQSSASRLTNWLADKTRTGKPGLNWITKEQWGQTVRVYLTPLGQSVAREIWETAYGQT